MDGVAIVSDYYDCNYLTSLRDKNGNIPEIFITDGNRTAGKSVSYKKRLIDTFLKKSDINQFILIYRYKTDMSNCAESFFTDLKRLFYTGREMTEKRLFDGAVIQLELDGLPCGFCVPLSLASKIKKYSPIFSSVRHMFFDEYQDEDSRYLADEVSKLMSIHTTVARGDGKQVRYVPLYMASNTVSMLNPYYSALGINKMLKKDTKILRGDGWVFEKTYNENAKEAFQEAGFNKAFKKSKYFDYASQNVYLNDNLALIETPSGYANYFMSVKYNGAWYNFRKYSDCMYCAKGHDETYPIRVCINVTDVVDDRAIKIGTNDYLIQTLRQWFDRGVMRFENLECKNMTLDLLAYL